MIFILIFFIFLLGLYISFFYKKRWFILKSKYGLPVIFLLITFFLSGIWFFSYQIRIYEKNTVSSSDILFLLDISKSMWSFDDWEMTRLQLWKEFIKNYISKNLSNTYWLSVFAGESLNILPLTFDTHLLGMFLENIDEKTILKWGSNILWALKNSISRFDENHKWALIILSDFETHLPWSEKEKLLQDIEKIGTDLDKKDIKLIFIWFGKETWSKIFESIDLFWKNIYKKDKNNKEIMTKFDKEFFTSFSFDKYQINNWDDISKIDIKNIPASNIDKNEEKKIDTSRYFMIVAFFCFLCYLGLFCYFDKKWK